LVEDEFVAHEKQEGRKGKVEEQGEEERQPPSNIFFSVGCGYGHEASDVDEEVKPKDDSLGGGLRVFDDSFALFGGNDFGNGSGDLVEKERGDVGLEHGCVVLARIISSIDDSSNDLPAPIAKI
jgi:hypothetical protein